MFIFDCNTDCNFGGCSIWQLIYQLCGFGC